MRQDIDVSDPDNSSYKLAFEEYKLLLEWTNQLADRRQVTSNIFLGVNSTVVAVLTLIASGQYQNNERTLPYMWTVIVWLGHNYHLVFFTVKIS